MTVLRVLVLGVLLLAGAISPARAGVPPIGTWVSARGAGLVVTDQATCSFLVPTAKPEGARAEGDCTWQSTDTGGILKIVYQATTTAGTPRDAVLYLDIRWINQLVIAVQGEVFRRTR